MSILKLIDFWICLPEQANSVHITVRRPRGVTYRPNMAGKDQVFYITRSSVLYWKQFFIIFFNLAVVSCGHIDSFDRCQTNSQIGSSIQCGDIWHPIQASFLHSRLVYWPAPHFCCSIQPIRCASRQTKCPSHFSYHDRVNDIIACPYLIEFTRTAVGN